MIALSLLVAAATAPAETPPADAPPPRHFLKGAEPRGCDAPAAKDEVVVCGREDMEARFRLRAPDDSRYVERPVRAEAQVLGNGTLKAHGEQAAVGGFTAPRAMVTLSWPF